MYSHMSWGTAALGPGPGASSSRPASTSKHQVVHHRALQPGLRGQPRLGNIRARQDFKDEIVRAGKRVTSKEGDVDQAAGSGLDIASVFRNVFDFSSSKAAATAGAASMAAAGVASRPAAAAQPPYDAVASQMAASGAPLPPGPYAAAQMLVASSAVAGAQPMGMLAEQVLTGHAGGQDDPVAAARQLQLFLSQYRDQYGPETDARISAAVGKLQEYIQGYSVQGDAAAGSGSAGLLDAFNAANDAAAGAGVMGAFSAAAGARAENAAGVAAGGAGGSDGVVYHNYILEQLTGVLDWVNNLLHNNPKPYVFDAYGRILDSPGVAATVEQQQEQLRAASNSLRILIQQLQQVNRQYASMADPDEKAAMGQVLSQLTTMADRLAVAATRRPIPPGAGAAMDAAASAATDLAPYVRPEQTYGVESYRDPLLRVLDGIYHAVVVDSGLREFLTGIKQLGDSLASSMAVTWTGAPPIGRLIAYIAAVAGVLFVMRTRLPKSLLTPTNKFLGQLGVGGGGGGGANGKGNGGGDSGSGTDAASATASTSSALFTSPSFPGSVPKPPAGGWTSEYSDRADWWSAGQQQQQPPPPPPPPSQQQQQSSPVPSAMASSDAGAADLRPRTVAESWEAFRRTSDGPATASPAYMTSGSTGVMDTTAALAAAAVAAAVGSVPAADPKMRELARATEEKRISKDRARLRATIKDRLRWVCLALGPVSSVVPGGEPLRDEVDGLLAQLEALSPTDKPLNTVVDVTRRPTVGAPAPLVDPMLLGDWRLVYASNASGTPGVPNAASQAAGGGPNLLAQVLQIADSLPGFGMTHVVQRLSLEEVAPPTGLGAPGSFSGVGASLVAPSATICTENSAVFRFGPLGSWRVSVRGRWIDNGGGLCAAAEFESFSVRPVDLWGLPVEQLLPEVVVPVPDVLRSRSEWCTTYLDEEMRVGRGSGGALFLFKRGATDTETAAGPAAAPGAAPPRVAAGAQRAPANARGPAGAAAAAAAAAASSTLSNPVMRTL